MLCLFGRQPSYSCELSLLVRIQSHLERPECLAGCMVVGKQCSHAFVVLRYRFRTGILGLATQILVSDESCYPRQQE